MSVRSLVFILQITNQINIFFFIIIKEHDGFYKHSELIKMRKVMRRKFKALTEGKILKDEDFDDLLNAHDDESENEDGGEDEEISDIDSESKDEQIISRVRISD